MLPVTWKLLPELLLIRTAECARPVDVMVRAAVWKNRLLLIVQSVLPLIRSIPADDSEALK